MIQQAVLGAKGEAAIVAFSDSVTVLQDFTASVDQISDAFNNLQAADTGRGRMLDAVGSRRPASIRSTSR